MRQSKENNKDNDNKAIYVGIVLIVLVISLTILRPYLFAPKKDNSSSGTVDKSSETQKKMAVSTLQDKIDKKEEINIIDVRDADSFSAEHITHAQNVPFADLDSFIANIDKNKTYILVDQLEDPALKDLTENILPKEGLNNVYYLAGGFSGWKNQEMTTISGGDPFSLTDQAKVGYINSDELKKEIESNENLYVIDLRKSDAFADGHIKNAVNIYLGDLESRQKEIPLGKKIVLVDNDGLWAFKGAVLLFDMNTFNVFSLSDGLDSWKQKGYEIVK